MSFGFRTDLIHESKSPISKYNWLRALKSVMFGRCQPIRSRAVRTSRLRLELIEDRLVPSAFTVNVLGDASGVSGGTGVGLTGDLRWCINQALASSGSDTIDFDAVAFSSAQTITLSPTLTTDPHTANRYGPTAFVIDNDNITITGSTAGVAIDGGGARRLFAVTSTATLTLQNLTLQGGAAVGTDGPSGGGGGAGMGGGVFVDGGALTVAGSTFRNNTAQGGGSVPGGNGNGGGLGTGGGTSTFGVGGAGEVSIAVLATDGGFGGGGGAGGFKGAGNGGFGGGGGGGGFAGSGGFGGGAGTSLGGGGAGMGGAIFNNQGVVNLTNDTFTANTAAGSAPAGGAPGSGLGGAVFTRNGTLNATYVTFSLNTAVEDGTDIYVRGDNSDGGSGTSPGSGSGAVTLTNSILGQTITIGTDFIYSTSGPAIAVSGTNNLFSSTTGGLFFTNTIAAMDPMLGALASNGGPTQTMAPQAGSPVIGAGVGVGGIATDQRGHTRPVTGATDIGAYQSIVLTTAPVVTTPATAVSVNTTTFNVAGTAVAGSLVQVYSDFNNNGIIDGADAVVGSQQLGAGVTSYSITVPLTANAANNFLVTATGVDPESLVTDVPTITADSTAPAAPVVTTPATAVSFNATTSTITGTAEAGSLVQVYSDFNNNGIIDGADAVVGQQQLGAGLTSYSISVPLTANTANNFLVTSTDAAGNASPVADVPTITADSISPAAPVVTTPATAVSVNATTFTIAGTAEAGSLVQVYSDFNNNGIIDGADAVVGQQQLGVGVTSYSISVPLTANSANNFLVRATDAASNVSVLTDVPTITADSIAPIAPVVTSPAAATSVNATTFAIAGTAEAGSLVQVYVDVNNNGVIDSGDTVVASQQLGVGLSSYSISTPLTANSANNFLVTATDAAGNASPVADVPTITADSTAPIAPVVTSPAAATSVNATTFAIAGTAEAGSLVQVYVDVNNNGVIDSGDTVVGSQQLGGSATSYSISIPLTANAANNFLVTATDGVGNASVVTDVPTITADSIAPAAPSVTSPTTTQYVNTGTIAIAGTAEAGSLVQVYSDFNNNGIIDGADAVVGQQQLGVGVTSYSISVPLTANSANNFLVRATDAAGNASLATDVATIVADSIAPAAPSVTNPTSPQVVNALTTYTLTGSVEVASLVKVYRDVNNNGIIDAGDTLVGQQQLSDGTDYSIVVPLLDNTANNFLVTATDRAGNASLATGVPTITQFSTAPVSGVVFLDYNADGVRNGPDVGLAGRRVFIDANGNGVFDSGEVSTFTDGTGAYVFEGVAAGTRSFRVELFPSEIEIGQPSNGTRSVTAGQSLSGTDLGLRQPNPAFSVATSANLYGTNNPDPETAVAQGLFVSVLGREGSAAEVQSWASLLQRGLSVAAAGRAFVTSDEAIGNQVDGLYRVYLGRAADALGRAAWVQVLRQGVAYEEVAAHFLGSAEYQARYPGAEAFVRSLFHNQLGREGSAFEVQNDLALLQSGVTPAALARAFVYTQESYVRVIESMYAQFLNRPAEEAGLLNWLAFTAPGGRLTDLAVYFVSLSEFGIRADVTVV